MRAATIAVTAASALLVAAVILYIDRAQGAAHREREQRSTLQQLELRRSSLQGRFNSDLNYTTALRSFVLSRLQLGEAIDARSFAAFAATLPNADRTLVSLQLAPAGVIAFEYPPQRERSVVGGRLLEMQDITSTVQRALADRALVVDGPRELTQGGSGLVARLPIYADGDALWGFAIVLFDDRRLVEVGGVHGDDAQLRLALRGKDGLGAQGEVFFGDAALFAADPVLLDIRFPNGSWQLAGLPRAGWSKGWGGRVRFLWLAGLAGVLLVLLVFRYLQQGERLQQSERSLRVQATEDSLTRLANRRALQEHLAAEWRRGARTQSPLSVLLLDVDHFKQYNDRHGHLAGDDCLRNVAAEVSAAAKRPADLAARYGGEEFVLVLPDTAPVQAAQVAETLRAAVARRELAHESAVNRVSISIGVAGVVPATGTPEGTAIEDLLARADAALYRAKHAGRDRVELDE